MHLSSFKNKTWQKWRVSSWYNSKRYDTREPWLACIVSPGCCDTLHDTRSSRTVTPKHRATSWETDTTWQPSPTMWYTRRNVPGAFNKTSTTHCLTFQAHPFILLLPCQNKHWNSRPAAIACQRCTVRFKWRQTEGPAITKPVQTGNARSPYLSAGFYAAVA